MDKGAWQATVPGIAEVGHELSTKERECSSEPSHPLSSATKEEVLLYTVVMFRLINVSLP